MSLVADGVCGVFSWKKVGRAPGGTEAVDLPVKGRRLGAGWCRSPHGTRTTHRQLPRGVRVPLGTARTDLYPSRPRQGMALSRSHDDKAPHDGLPSVRPGQRVGICGPSTIHGFCLQIAELVRARELIGWIRPCVRGLGIPRLHHVHAPRAVSPGHLEPGCFVDCLAGPLQFRWARIGVYGRSLQRAGRDSKHCDDGDDRDYASLGSRWGRFSWESPELPCYIGEGERRVDKLGVEESNRSAPIRSSHQQASAAPERRLSVTLARLH